VSFADHARHCALLLDALGLQDAHVCGHSSGALVALQLALDAPTAVRTLTLLEPAPGGDLGEPADGEAIGRLLGPAIAAAAAGDVDTAFDTFLEAVGGSGARALVERTLGVDGLQMAVGQARTLMGEAQAVTGWRFTSDDASRITQPLLLVQGGRSHELAPFAPSTIPTLAAMAPHARVVTLPGVTHLMPLQDPAGVAALLADFIAEHLTSDASNKRLDT
jgi:pimeloyl-ACP methyl ester carboxylesterase